MPREAGDGMRATEITFLQDRLRGVARSGLSALKVSKGVPVKVSLLASVARTRISLEKVTCVVSNQSTFQVSTYDCRKY